MGIIKVLIAIILVYVIDLIRFLFYESILHATSSTKSDFNFRLVNAILLAAWVVKDGLL